MTGVAKLSVPEFILTMSPDHKTGHLTKSLSLDEVMRDRDLMSAAFPFATLWKRDPDGKMEIVDGGRYE